MGAIVSLYSKDTKEIYRFLNKYNKDYVISKSILEWKKEFKNPVEIADLIGVYIDNNESFNLNMWVSLDNDFFINITDHNADQIIRYLFERYPY